MRRAIILTVWALLAGTLTMAAQKGLNINSLFDGRYMKSKNATETIITGSALAQYNVDVYHGVTIVDDPSQVAEIEKLVAKDGAKAASREVYYQAGKLYYGFYELTPKDGNNRYIFYLNKNPLAGNLIVLIYIEGKASARQIKQMLN